MRHALYSLAFLTLATSPAFASWAAVPLEILVDEADLIVVGKVAKVRDGGFTVGARKFDVAVVEVSGVLKSLNGNPKEVHIGQPAAGGGIAVSTDIQFPVGQQGIWLLTKDPEKNVYWAKHPFQFQDAKNQKEITALIAARAKVPGGKTADGLVARAELVEHKSAKGPSSFEVRFSVKNVSEKAITICDYSGNRSLLVAWKAPDGSAPKSNHYDWLARGFLPELMKNNFVTLPPGGVRFIGPRGSYSGVWFQTQPSPHVNQAQVGQQDVTLSFANKEGGMRFGVENVWQGTVTANTLEFTVK